MSNSIVTELFTEKFRPKDFASLIAPPRIKNELSRGLVQNLLLYGSAGTGKTSTLFILAKPYTTLYNKCYKKCSNTYNNNRWIS